MSIEPKLTRTDAVAFFYDMTSSVKLREENRRAGKLGEIHLHLGKGCKLGLVVHEATHAAVAYLHACRLDIYGTHGGEEEFVKAVQHITEGVMWSLNRLKRNGKL